MLQHTDTEDEPWHIVRTDDKPRYDDQASRADRRFVQELF